ncbi:MAG TPA: hypothetical protein VHW23_18550, partial [Kofleriaceae bacterium]|nr:hypothetical protein [Kofleriaceae bacterium]
MRVVLVSVVLVVLVVLGSAGCGGDAGRPAPVALDVRIVSGPSGLVRDPRPTWAFMVVGTADNVDCVIDSGTAVPCHESFTPAADLAEGPHEFAVRATGADGDQAVDSRKIQVDAAAPAIALQAPLIPSRTSNQQPVVSFTVDDASQVATTCSIDGGPAVPCDTRFGAAATLAEGVHAYRLTATDAAGNASILDVGFVVDITPPAVTITGAPASQTDDDTPSFEFTTSADTTRARCEIDTGEVIDPCTTGVTFPALATGPRTFTVTAFDDAVPPNAASATFSFVLATGQCGDGVKNGNELCDGSDFGTTTCGSLGHASGTLVCNATCDGFDAGGCDGGFVAAADGFAGRPCFDGVKFGQPGLLSPHLVACTEDNGVLMTSLSDPAIPVSWARVTDTTGGTGTPISNLHGRAVVPQPDGPATLYLADDSTMPNGFRSTNVMQPPASLSWTPVTFADAGMPIALFAVAPGNSTNNVVGGWDAARGAVVLHGNFAATAAISAVGATGTVRAIAKGAASDIYVAVWGQTPAGDPATGGIFLTCDQVGTAGGTYVERDTGIAADDLARVWSITVDPSSVTQATRTCGAAMSTGFATTYYTA